MPDDVGQLTLATGRRHGQPVHVTLHVEVLVPLPHREVQTQRHSVQLARECRDLGSPFAEVLAQALEGVAARDGRRVEQDESADVHQLLGRLQIQETRIEPAEPVHCSPPKLEQVPMLARACG